MKQKHLVPDQLPNYVKADHPTFVEFVQAYYKWFQEQYSLDKFENLVDVDKTVDEFLMYFKKQYDVFNVLQGIDNRFYLRRIKELYSAKGSAEAIKYLFRIKYEEQADVRLPWDDVLKISDGKWFQETGTIVKVRYGNIQSIIGDFVYLIDSSGLKFKTSVKNVTQRVADVYELAINRFSCGKRRFVRVESLDGTIAADIVLTITSANVEPGRGGKNFRVGQVFSIRGVDGSESLLKVKSVDNTGYQQTSESTTYDYAITNATWNDGVATITIDTPSHKIRQGQKITISGIESYNGTFTVTGVGGTTILIGPLNEIEQISSPPTPYSSGGLLRHVQFNSSTSSSTRGAITAVEVFGFGYGFQKDFNIIVAPFDQKPEIGPNIQIIVTDEGTDAQGSYTFETDDNISARIETGNVLRHDYTNVPGKVAANEILEGGIYLIASIGTTNFKELSEPVYLDYPITNATWTDGNAVITINTSNHKIQPGEKIIISGVVSYNGEFVVTGVSGDDITIGILNGSEQILEPLNEYTSGGTATFIHFPSDVNELFTAKKSGTGTGTAIQVYGPPISVEYVTNNVFYNVETPGTTDFTVVGGPQTGLTDYIVVNSEGVNVATNTFTVLDNQPHGFVTGDEIRYFSTSDDTFGTVDVIQPNNVYYAIVTSASQFKLAPTLQDAQDGTPISLSYTISSQNYVFAKEQSFNPLIISTNNIAGVEVYYPNHGLQLGDSVQYVRSSNSYDGSEDDLVAKTPFPGLQYNTIYYITNVNPDYFDLASSKENALKGNPISGIPNTPILTSKFDYLIPIQSITGTIFKAQYPNQNGVPLPQNPLTGSGTLRQTMFNSVDQHSASRMLPNNVYKIVSVGTTDFTTAGAQSNTVGEYFVATKAATGTGVVESLMQISYVYDLTYVGDVVAKIIDRQQFKKEESDFAYIRCKVGCVYQYPGFYLKSDSIIGDTAYIQDSEFYQVYSYLVVVERVFNEYSDTLKKALHPAGTKLFGDFAINNQFQFAATAKSDVNLISKRDEIVDFVQFTELLAKIVSKNIPLTIKNSNVANNIVTITDHGYETGDSFVYHEGSEVSELPSPIPGLVSGGTYYLKQFPFSSDEAAALEYDVSAYTRYSIAESWNDLYDNQFLEVSSLPDEGQHKFIVTSSYWENQLDVEYSIDPRPWPIGNVVTDWNDALDPAYQWNNFYSPLGDGVFTSLSGIRVDNQIALDFEDETGSNAVFDYIEVTYDAGPEIFIPGYSIEGLISGQTYYIIRVNDNEFKFANSYQDAIDGLAISIGTVTGDVPLYKDYTRITDSLSFRSENLKITAQPDSVDANEQLNFLTWKGSEKILLEELDKYEGDSHFADIGDYGGVYWEPHYVELVPAYWQAGYLNTERQFTN